MLIINLNSPDIICYLLLLISTKIYQLNRFINHKNVDNKSYYNLLFHICCD